MYVAVKGGKEAIKNAHNLLAKERRGDLKLREISVSQISEQMKLAVSRIMAEGSLYAPEFAALAMKQAQGDMIEAIFLLRAARTTFPRFGYSEPVDTGNMLTYRRISGTWKDLPGGQILGATYDYTHRLLDDSLLLKKSKDIKIKKNKIDTMSCPKATDILINEKIIEEFADSGKEPTDVTRVPVDFPLGREGRLQHLARADEGFLLSLAYSSQRGYGVVHPFVSELRLGEIEVEFIPEELGFPITLGKVEITECETVNQFRGSAQDEPLFTRGYGLVFGNNERKALSMAIVDRALRKDELNEEQKGVAQDEEFVMMHSDNVEASGFVQHIKLPHYVDFQSELQLLRNIRKSKRNV